MNTFLAELKEKLELAEDRYREEQRDGDEVSIASTRAYFLALRDAMDLARKHIDP